MQLNKITINNFRNYSLETMEPGRMINVVYGENGEGKTNLLESIYYILSSLSHRTKKEKELLKWDEKKFIIKSDVLLKSGQITQLKASYSELSKKTLKVNGEKLTTEKYFSRFPVVIMYPQDLYLVAEGPLERRKFLNSEIIRLNPQYYHHLINYYRALRQRNIILKDPVIINEDSLTLWDDLLAEHGSKLIKLRIEYLKRLSPLAGFFQKKFTAGNEEIELKYKTQLDIKENNDKDSLEVNENYIKKLFSEKIINNRREELKRGFTVYGPHVDDMKILLNSKEMKKFSSQGQQRTMVISLKMAQAELLLKEKQEKPLLLMDDCFSELDEKRSGYILEVIHEKELQCFITTYEKLRVPENDLVSFFAIKEGKIYNG